MIQRIQTVYLLLVIGLLIASMCLPMGYFVDENSLSYVFSPWGVALATSFYSTWGIVSILFIATVITLATVFLYKNRVLQLRMTIFNSILIIGYYLAFLAFMFTIKKDLNASFQIHWALCLPLIALILNYLAIRAIGRDEVLVKAADRLR